MTRTVSVCRTMLRSWLPTPSTAFPLSSLRPTLEELETRLAPAAGLTLTVPIGDAQVVVAAKVSYAAGENNNDNGNDKAGDSSDKGLAKGQLKFQQDNEGPGINWKQAIVHAVNLQSNNDNYGTGNTGHNNSISTAASSTEQSSALSSIGSGQNLAGLGLFLTESQTNQPSPGDQHPAGQGDNRGNIGAPTAAERPPASDLTAVLYAPRSTQLDQDEAEGEKQVQLSSPEGKLLGQLPQGELEVEAATAPQAELVVVPAVVKGPLTDRMPGAGELPNQPDDVAAKSEALALPAWQMLSLGLEDSTQSNQANQFRLPQNPQMGAAVRSLVDQLLQNLTLSPLTATPNKADEETDVVPPAGDDALELDDSAANDFAFLSAANQEQSEGSGWEVPATLALMPLLLSARLENRDEERKHRTALRS